MIEAMNMCMVVGLSVDYVVHLAEGYTLSLHTDRLSRVRDMLDLMGVSVFFGACTTLGASLFMFFTVLSFFSQFGTFLFSTIGFSLVFSMGLFVTLLGIIGPEGNTGNVLAFFRRVCGERSRRRKSRRDARQNK
jgi:predicted RND superfamily exporter protein